MNAYQPARQRNTYTPQSYDRGMELQKMGGQQAYNPQQGNGLAYAQTGNPAYALGKPASQSTSPGRVNGMGDSGYGGQNSQYNMQQSYGNYQPPGGYNGLSQEQPTYGIDMGMAQGPRNQQGAYNTYGSPQGYGGQAAYNGGYGGQQQGQMAYGSGDVYTGQPYGGIGNPMQGGAPTGGYPGKTGGTSGSYQSPVNPQGPYGSGDMSQSPYNPNGPMSTEYRGDWTDAIAQLQGHNLGDLGDPKNAAAQQIWLSGYANPLIQANQNLYTQQANQAQWGANFNEQQYLNKNQVGLDWAASGREDAGLNYAIQSGQQAFGEGQRQFDTTSGQNQQKLNTEQAQQEALAQYQSGQISLGEAQNKIDAARQKGDAAFQQGQLKNTTYENQTGRTKVANDYAIAQKQNQLVAQQNNIDSLYKQGLISVQEKDAKTAALKEQHDYLLGQGANANTATANANTLTLGKGQLANTQYANQTGRTQVNNDYAVAVEQNKIDRLYKTGNLSNDQYQAQTARLQQQSQQSQWQQQLAAQSGQFGQTLALQYAQLQQEAQNARLQAFGKVRAPNMAAYNQSWY